VRLLALPTTGPVDNGVQLEVLATIDPLQPEWSELAEQSRSVFQTWEWAANWWRHFGRDRLLRVATIRLDGKLVGILPLYVWATRPLRILRFLGHGPGDELGPIVDAGHRPAVARALPAVLAQLDWDLILAEQLPADQGWSDPLAGRRILGEASPVLEFGDGGWERFLRTRSRNFREQLGRRERKLAREHQVRYRLADGARDLASDLDILFRLHRARWAGRYSAFLADEPFHRSFAAAASERGWLRLWVLEVDGEPVAAVYGFRLADTECYYQAGRDRRWDHYRVGFVLLAHAIREAADDGIVEYRLLRGDEEYKHRFGTHDPGLETVGVSRGLAAPGLRLLDTSLAMPGLIGSLARQVTGRFLATSHHPWATWRSPASVSRR
jgi:CelD/BcsL family acetyltransferase involved in cellulose biosynthesis